MTVGKGQKFEKRKWKPVRDVKSSKIKSKKKKRPRNDDQMEIGWVSFGKKIGFNSSEMTKKFVYNSLSRAQFYLFCALQFVKIIQLLTLLVLRIWLSFATLESSNCLAEKKFIYGYRCPWLRSLHDLIINGFFPKFCFLVCFLFPCQYWHFFFQVRTCVRA